ncbi:3'-5' exonuclease [Tengunoibacter tsumagoiensis]|uniref:Exonuclease domain-containing protein n=1 Tax=Tengunoibacter tsumagoiensis TaxID=2014871 RepID=A0A402A7Z8_9CHLR|nr:3'-5' exonuclease [Tengunoibacter tsumagoiensis]GCE15300.1 hypothetical protein KTT_51590 [Tengunoibacter tsumagoiensis]
MEKKRHVLSQQINGNYTCSVCLGDWKKEPSSLCPGAIRYLYGSWPEHLYTYTQLRRLKLKPLGEPEGCYFIQKAPYIRYLYNIQMAVPRRVPTDRQREAITKMRAALVQTYTCLRCGFYDSSHGRDKHHYLILGHCPGCRWEIQQKERQVEACLWAAEYIKKTSTWVVLDSETTGLGDSDEIIELAIVSASGAVVFSSLIQPQDPARHDLATHIHGITPEMLQTAPTFPEVWPTIKTILRRYRNVLVYNADFDRRLLRLTAERYGYRLPSAKWEDLMQPYAAYHGAWNSYYRSYTWQKLGTACDMLGVETPEGSHRATADAQSALGVLKALAARADSSDKDDSPLKTVALEASPPLGEIENEDHPF